MKLIIVIILSVGLFTLSPFASSKESESSTQLAEYPGDKDPTKMNNEANGENCLPCYINAVHNGLYSNTHPQRTKGVIKANRAGSKRATQ